MSKEILEAVRGLAVRHVRSMIDFVTILRTAIDKQGDSSPEVRARIYEKALEALGRLAGTHSPLAIEDYRVALEEAVGEIERSYGDPTKTTFETLSPSFSLSEDAFHIRPRIRPASIFPPSAAPRPEAAPHRTSRRRLAGIARLPKRGLRQPSAVSGISTSAAPA